jgi:hypothetical protein
MTNDMLLFIMVWVIAHNLVNILWKYNINKQIISLLIVLYQQYLFIIIMFLSNKKDGVLKYSQFEF